MFALLSGLPSSVSIDHYFERGEWVTHKGRLAVVDMDSNGQAMVHIRVDGPIRDFIYVPFHELERVASRDATKVAAPKGGRYDRSTEGTL